MFNGLLWHGYTTDLPVDHRFSLGLEIYCVSLVSLPPLYMFIGEVESAPRISSSHGFFMLNESPSLPRALKSTLSKSSMRPHFSAISEGDNDSLPSSDHDATICKHVWEYEEAARLGVIAVRLALGLAEDHQLIPIFKCWTRLKLFQSSSGDIVGFRAASLYSAFCYLFFYSCITTWQDKSF